MVVVCVNNVSVCQVKAGNVWFEHTSATIVKFRRKLLTYSLFYNKLESVEKG